MIVDPKLLVKSPLLRKKAAELERLARDVRIATVYEEMLALGERPTEAIAGLSGRFAASPSTVKRAVRKHSAPPWNRKHRRAG